MGNHVEAQVMSLMTNAEAKLAWEEWLDKSEDGKEAFQSETNWLPLPGGEMMLLLKGTMKTYEIITEAGNRFITKDPVQALQAIEKHGHPCEVAIRERTEAEYNSVQATNSSSEFFKG